MMIKSLNAASRRALAPSGRRRLSSAASLSTDPSIRCIQLEDRYGAHNYHPLPVVLAKGKGKRSECSFASVVSP
jgi:hypothetical protein